MGSPETQGATVLPRSSSAVTRAPTTNGEPGRAVPRPSGTASSRHELPPRRPLCSRFAGEPANLPQFAHQAAGRFGAASAAGPACTVHMRGQAARATTPGGLVGALPCPQLTLGIAGAAHRQYGRRQLVPWELGTPPSCALVVGLASQQQLLAGKRCPPPVRPPAAPTWDLVGRQPQLPRHGILSARLGPGAPCSRIGDATRCGLV